MSLEFRHVAHFYGRVRALEDVSLTAPSGEITCLLGASGCGKSTLLNLAAGLLPLQHGSIFLDGVMLADPQVNPPPEARPVGLVFQDGALFPHMTIAKNIAFGLPEEQRSEVAGWLERVGMAGLGIRYPHELSGGQQQRVALARAMAPGPTVLLMDEPFASVDIVLRRKLRRDCRILLREAGATVVLVTHDPAEALDIADRIAVMEAGRIVQFGTPEELHDAPATASVGAIFGGAQIVEAQRSEAGFETLFGSWSADCVAGGRLEGDMFDLLIHAGAIDLVPDAAGMAVRDVHSLGRVTRVLLATEGGAEITVETHEQIAATMRYRVIPRSASVRAFRRD